MRIRHYTTLLFLLFSVILQAQNDTINYSLNTRLNMGTGRYAPFLSTANQYDRFSLKPNTLSVWGTLNKAIKKSKDFDYGFGLELDGNTSIHENRFFPGEVYVQGKMYFLNVYAGMKQQVFGNQDEELSSGGMLWSQNSRPMPKIAIESNGYLPIPYTHGYVEVKGGLSHGWFNDQSVIQNLLLHHKYGYVRLGGSLPVNLSYGIQHVAQWGGRSVQYGTMPVTWDNYFRIFLGKSGSSTANWSDQENTLGNHILSQNLGLDVKLKVVDISFYWQNITEDPPTKFIDNTPNVEDGLWGMSVRLPKFKPLNHLVFEYLSTTDMSGPWGELDGVIYGGGDSYYTNGDIPNGWTYRGMTIGNPWITSPKYNADGSPSIANNVVRLYYFSGTGIIHTFNYKLTLAYSKNYGLPKAIYDNYKKQFSWQLETSRAVNFLKNTRMSLGISGDRGAMYGNNLAVIVGVSYSGFWGY